MDSRSARSGRRKLTSKKSRRTSIRLQWMKASMSSGMNATHDRARLEAASRIHHISLLQGSRSHLLRQVHHAQECLAAWVRVDDLEKRVDLHVIE